MKNFIKKGIPVLLVLLLGLSTANAKPIKKLDFIGVTNSEKVIITVNDKDKFMEYQTPKRTTKYELLDYDYGMDFNTGDQIVTCTAVDTLYGIAYSVLLYSNKAYCDIRIGKKRLTFKHVSTFEVE